MIEFKTIKQHAQYHNYKTINKRIVKTEQNKEGDIIIREIWPMLPDRNREIVIENDRKEVEHV